MKKLFEKRAQKKAELDALTEARKNAPEGSMTAKANMVAEFNNRNTKK